MNKLINQKTDFEFSIVIPCYNSEGSIQTLLNEIIKHTNFDLFKLKEIICVNDCSQDQTLEKILEIKKNIDILEIINNQSNLGQVRSTILGINKSSGNYIVTLDDDLQHPPKEIGKLLNFCHENNYDFVTGYWKNDETFLRNLTSSIANLLINLIVLGNLKYRITAFRVINSNLKNIIIDQFKNNELMDLRKVSSNFSSFQIEHNPKPLNREFSKFFPRFKITFKYIFFDNILISIFIFIISIFLIVNFN